MSEKVKKSIIVQGGILAMAGIISKIIGFLYRIPMANIMGNAGNGLYSVAFGIYNVALTLSSYSMPLAVSKLMSERLSKKEYKNAHKLFARALFFALITGTIACFALYMGADNLAVFYHKQGLERPLRVLAPTTFVVALLGTARGYFQGHRNMVPTAASQILEQVINAIVSVVATATFVASCPVQGDIPSYGAMGGTFGTLAGAGAALIFFICLFIKKYKNSKEEMHQEDLGDEDVKLIWKAIFATVFPIILSQTIYQLGYTIDDYVYGNLMSFRGIDEKETTILQGIFNTQYNQMINLPVAIATSMAAATLPSVVASYSVNDHEQVQKKMNRVIKINMQLAIPASVGLMVLADPIMYILFPGLQEYHNTAVTLLMSGSSAVVFYALSTLSTSILQGCNRMRVPLIHSAIALVIHVFIITVLLRFTDLGVYALIIGNVTFPLTVSVMNIFSIDKLLEYSINWKTMIIKPFIASIIMGFAALLNYQIVYTGFSKIINDKASMIIALAISMLIALVLYGRLLIWFKAVSKEDIKSVPIFNKFV